MKFSEITSWGYVDAGTKVTDESGNKYVVGEQNDKGFVPLRNLSGGKIRFLMLWTKLTTANIRLLGNETRVRLNDFAREGQNIPTFWPW